MAVRRLWQVVGAAGAAGAERLACSGGIAAEGVGLEDAGLGMGLPGCRGRGSGMAFLGAET